MKKLLWVVVCCVMALSLLMASCSSDTDDDGKTTDTGSDDKVTITESETSTGSGVYDKDETDDVIEVSSELPQYGGTINLLMTANEPDFDLINWFSTQPQHLAHQALWEGDWTKGPAGGYGDNTVTWEDNTNIPDLNKGLVAERWSWVVNDKDNTVTTTLIIRDNIYFQQKDTEAGRLAAGRKMTTEDVAWCMQQQLSNPDAQNYQGFPETRDVVVEVTGPNEIQIVHPFALHLDSIMRLMAYSLVFPPELWDAFGYNSCTDPLNSVGTGPYYIDDYVPSNMITLKRNDNYWENDPIGPGLGQTLPYADSVKYTIIPDSSTQQAALRTGKLDMMALIAWEDAEYLEKQVTDIMKARRGSGQVPSAFFRLDQAPFDDVNVRRALLYGINLNEINDSLYKGLGDLISFPYYYTPGYDRLYLGLNDPEMPAEVKDMYSYNPAKAKELLAEAGYPDGLQTDIVMSNAWPGCVDYYSIAKEYWSQIGVDVELKLLPDNGQLISTNMQLGFDGMIAQFISPVSTFPEQAQYTGDSWLNPSRVSDPYVIQMAADIRAQGVTDLGAAMDMTKELTKYMLDQVYAIPTPRYPNYCMWWPWIKNYSGEVNVGYMVSDNWVKYVWVDEALQNDMGY